MKKVILFTVAILATLQSLSAQELSRWSLGPRVGIYTNTGDDAILGIGVASRFAFAERWRLEPALTILFHEDSSIDANLDVNYLFKLSEDWTLYPLVGVTVNDFGEWAFGMNLGGGVDFWLSKRWSLSMAAKWMPIFKESHKNPIVITLKGSYNF